MSSPSADEVLTEEDLVRGFEEGTLGEFPHASHVRLTLVYLRRHGRDEALRRMMEGLRKFVALQGVPEKFHVTLTQAWLDLLDSARQTHPEADAPEALVQACPELLDRDALLRFYSRDRLTSDAARKGWMPPDRAPDLDAKLLRRAQTATQ